MASSNKAVDIGGFFDNQAPPETDENKRKKRRKKAIGDVVHVTLRLSPDQWNKAHQFARSEGISLNQLVRLYHLSFSYKSFYIRVFADLFRMGNACEEHDRRDG
jgi:hypothetical protein